MLLYQSLLIPKLRCRVSAPDIFGAGTLDQWAVTHSLNVWLLLSQHPEVWALSLLTAQLISCSLTPVHHLYGIRSLIFFGRLWRPLGNSVLLSPGSIGISPLSTPHRHPFQRMCVRPSTTFYSGFSLDMDRSPGFGSTFPDLTRS